jgi:hypothetical protein
MPPGLREARASKPSNLPVELGVSIIGGSSTPNFNALILLPLKASHLPVELEGPIREGSSTPEFDAFSRLVVLVLHFRTGQPKVAHLVDVSRTDQLVLFGPIEGCQELLSPKPPLLLRGAV